jgi:hypothetical protein
VNSTSHKYFLFCRGIVYVSSGQTSYLQIFRCEFINSIVSGTKEHLTLYSSDLFGQLVSNCLKKTFQLYLSKLTFNFQC